MTTSDEPKHPHASPSVTAWFACRPYLSTEELRAMRDELPDDVREYADAKEAWVDARARQLEAMP